MSLIAILDSIINAQIGEIDRFTTMNEYDVDPSGKCEQCNLDVDFIIGWQNYSTGEEKLICIDCAKKNNAELNQ